MSNVRRICTPNESTYTPSCVLNSRLFAGLPSSTIELHHHLTCCRDSANLTDLKTLCHKRLTWNLEGNLELVLSNHVLPENTAVNIQSRSYAGIYAWKVDSQL